MHSHGGSHEAGNHRRITLVGNPNVGKSVIFGLLTGRYVVVSNYPGTTIAISRGFSKVQGERVQIVDTPGVNSLIPFSEDERVARDILLDERPEAVIQVADSKNLRRALLITTQLAEIGLPIVLDLNMWDELMDRGMSINVGALQDIMNCPLVRTVATEKRGLSELTRSIADAKRPTLKVDYGERIENAVTEVEELLPELPVSRRAVALMLLSEDEALEDKLKSDWAGEVEDGVLKKVQNTRSTLQSSFSGPLSYVISKKRTDYVDVVIGGVASKAASGIADRSEDIMIYELGRTESNAVWRAAFFYAIMPLVSFFIGFKLTDLIVYAFSRYLQATDEIELMLDFVGGAVTAALFSIYLFRKEFRTKSSVCEVLGRLTMHPVAAFPILIVTLWLVYVFVGDFGAGTCVDFLESKVFGVYINPFLSNLLLALPMFSRDSLFYQLLFSKDAGLISVGLTYSIAIVFPIVSFFFLAFGIMEDSGYLPRLAIMVDKVFKKIGLNGKAVLPMVLGLGCDTMATLTARILDTKKERAITVLLLALAVPCSAQLGVISAVLGSVSGGYFALYVLIIFSQLLLVGYLASKVLPGSPSDFLMEIPPFRKPKLSNVVVKTVYRVHWFLKEAVPLFLLGTLILFVLTKLHLLELIERAGAPIVKVWLGLPVEATKGFILGFLRRDYGVISIFESLKSAGGASGPPADQLLVALVVITLFVPCLANFFVMIKEQGLRIALYMLAFIIPFSFLVGGLLRLILQAFNMT